MQLVFGVHPLPLESQVFLRGGTPPPETHAVVPAGQDVPGAHVNEDGHDVWELGSQICLLARAFPAKNPASATASENTASRNVTTLIEIPPLVK